MNAYSKIVVGTDGSESSFKAVERAAHLAKDAGAELIIGCAYIPNDDPRATARAQDQLKDSAYQVQGDNPALEILRKAREFARGIGAERITERTITGAPVDALVELVHSTKADLLVVGNKGLNSLAGRLLGSVPADVARKAGVDVVIVHTV